MKKNYSLFVIVILLLAANFADAQYCMLPGRTPYSHLQPGIRKFTLNKISRVSSNVESMSSVIVSTGMQDSLVGGNVYTVTLTHNEDSINFPAGLNNIAIYIDYNADQDFTDAGENVLNKKLIPAGVFTGTFMVPATVQTGITVMRVSAKMSEDLGHTAINPCDVPSDPLGYHGEMEDYWVDLYPKPAPNLTGVNENIETLSHTSIYPNPAKDELKLSYTLNAATPVTIELFDITGKKITDLADKKDAHTGKNELNISVKNYDNGVYFIRLQSGTSVLNRRITINN